MTSGTHPTPLVIAHRGASGHRPEHTISAYQLAIALGADAIEPDIVPTRDGVLVLRHENEISGTTDVAERPEFAERRTTKTIDGMRHTGWFTEDFTWAELATLRSRERLPQLRPHNTAFNGLDGILRLSDLLALLDASDRPVGLVAEIKHATYFASLGLPLDRLVAEELRAAGWHDDPRLSVESFELEVLHGIRAHGVSAPLVYLLEASGAPADRVARGGRSARPYSADLTPDGLTELRASGIAGISVDKRLLLRADAAGNTLGVTSVVDRAHAAGLTAFCWTLRPENRFLGRNLRREGGSAGHGNWLEEFQLVMSSRIDGVFADHPDLAIEARSRL
ncbi:glycerophosphodiester phosphodiesterase family protein [Salinibacterium sp. SYSU T00001]|uniref:glycerophosphodiester phosphodiesterase family protein n=1 Tax=Homoserinimonas sedimenticola TaxID=2986805 RepID=UPI0022357F09|nr:glycerophosphodiester phosphodiesterase family protein [Salinibacterium sedimenticola]MCW4386024.1 glycerophosphodiester phosphodiesterase family protein [Salinibacterium sedimenticola]